MKNLIFDFDGTIADSVALAKELANEILPKLGKDPLTDKDIEKIRTMTIPQGFKYVGVPFYKLPSLVVQAKQIIGRRIGELQPIDGVVEVLEKLPENTHIGILTSNTEKNVMSFLRRHKMTKYFDYIDTSVGIFTKSRKLKQTIKRHKLKKKDTIYVGDEIRDVEAAKSVGMPVAAVSWGANHPKVLKEYNPDYLIKKPKDLLKLI